MEIIESIISILDIITIFFATITMLAVLWNWYKNKKSNDKIVIYFQTQTETILLKNISIIRKHITRSEVLGILGVVQKNSKERYNIAYLSQTRFFNDLYDIQTSKSDKLVIEITDEELEQFDITK
ncbi:hypothetical protein [Sulfurimonas sp. RIFOXYB12_FULL_35_9]|uniref:hypothetical protein n=1 Tax=Sulfurimonas sp. RIFOXYB12_FULL_35_9 TaxID=1802256 RepID=UPI0008BEDAD2|nr:hypothetical protein [Sulfurimonas sp. RIFOXYB12_FULL_35_9]OHE05242.1 MAG: hypothetical protein A2345_12635 [Sulfurimonas sp. RIFOXYB12_FULL_35_9]